MGTPAPARTAADAVADAGLVRRVLAVLVSLAEAGSPLALREISGHCDLPPSTVHRLLQHLVGTGFAERAAGRRYRIGTELFRMSALVKDRMSIVRSARPVVTRIAEDWDATAILCLYLPTSRSCMHADLIKPRRQAVPAIEMHARLPLTWGATGRSMLAHLAWHDADLAIRESAPSPLTGRHLPARKHLLEQLSDIRQRGYATSCGELASDRIVCVATPIMTEKSAVLGSLAVTLERARWTPALESRIGPWLMDQGVQLTRRLNGQSA